MGNLVDAITKHELVLWVIKTLTYGFVAALFLFTLYAMISRMSEGAKTFWVGVHSDGGQPSWSRVASSVLLVCAIVWVSFVIYRTVSVPDVGGIVMLISSPYGINVFGKAGSMLANVFANRPVIMPPGSGPTTTVATVATSTTS